DGTLAVMSSLNILLLSKLASETEVGLYSAATQLMVPLLLVYQSMAQSIFPVMCRKVQSGYQSLKQIAEQAMELLLVLALPVVVDTFVNLLVGWPLIGMFGLRGAAIALLLTRAADCCQHYIPAAHLLSGIPIASIVWKPLVAAACMAAYLAAPAGRPGILAGVSATLIYGAALLAVAIWAS